MGLSLPILMFCGIAVVATLEQAIGTFLAWTVMGIFVVGDCLAREEHRRQDAGVARREVQKLGDRLLRDDPLTVKPEGELVKPRRRFRHW